MTRKRAYGLIGLAVLVAVGVTGVRVSYAKKATREQAMIYELKQLRSAVQIYTMASKIRPPDLKTALDAKFGFGPGVQWTMKRNNDQQPVDPFGNAYAYDTSTGWVASTSPGYEKW